MNKAHKFFLTLMVILTSYYLTSKLTGFATAPFAHSNSLQGFIFDEKALKHTSIDTLISVLEPSLQKTSIVQSLRASSVQYPNAKTILFQMERYPKSLLELAASRPETIDFVADYPKHQQNDSIIPAVSLSESFATGTIPLFLQWDKRWGYDRYGDDFIAVNGCGPTCLSMVAAGLTGNMLLTPKVIADYSSEHGYLTTYGTSWELMTKGAADFGITGSTLPADKAMILSLLQQGTPIIASMGPGHFTTEGHFIVLTGSTANGQITINDPASILLSQKTWDIDVILNECKNLWYFTS